MVFANFCYERNFFASFEAKHAPKRQKKKIFLISLLHQFPRIGNHNRLIHIKPRSFQWHILKTSTLIKKETKIFLIYKEIQKGAVAKAI